MVVFSGVGAKVIESPYQGRLSNGHGPPMTKVSTIHQTVTLPATPSVVYRTIVDPKQHAKFSGHPARLVAKPGGRFSHYGGAREGYVLLLQKNRRVVLAWRANSWAKGDYSIADFVLTKVSGGTRVEFTQSGVPTAARTSIASGWREHYWDPLSRVFSTP
jgi:activator of HSP90 ATPase